MKEFAMLAFVAIVGFQIFILMGKSEGNERPNEWQQSAQHVRRPAPASGPQRMNRRVPQGETAALVEQVSRDFNVPAGILYGVWQVESDGLHGGFGKKWQVASALVNAGNGCGTLSADACKARFAEIRAICAQQRNGKDICDPHEVRTSVALALGPMQIMPFNFLGVKRDGSTQWSGFAVDYDGDGIVDPHSLPDAMATAAKLLRHRFNIAKANTKAGKWQWATNAYYGSQNAGYYENVLTHWGRWCETRGCGASNDQRVAMR